MRLRDTHWRVLTLVSLVGCGFEIRGAPSDGPSEGPIDVPDGSMDRRTAVVVVNRISGTNVFALPFDDRNGFGNACSDTPASPSKILVSHPSLPYAYSVSNTLDGISVACGPMTRTTLGPVGDPRNVQRIVVDANAGVGFMTLDGPASVGLYRFTTDIAGMPLAVDGGSEAPGVAGALAADWTTKQVFVGGRDVVWSYPLSGSLAITASTQVMAAGCNIPIDLVLAGNSVYSFCSDTASVFRYTASPFAAAASAGTVCAVDAARSLTSSQAVVACQTPATLGIVDLGPMVTMTSGPPLTSRVTAMSASSDGKFVVTAQQPTAAETQLTVWSITGTSLSMLDTMMVTGVVTSVAVTATP